MVPYLARREGTCRHCGEEVVGMQWHLLGECQHPELVAAREAAEEATRRVMWEVLTDLKASDELVERVEVAFQSESYGETGDKKRWAKAVGHHRVAALGMAPRAGLFDPNWITTWWHEAGGGEVKRWRGGLKRWRTLGQRAVEECREMWRVAVRLLRQDQRAAAWETGRLARALRRRSRLKPEDWAMKLATEVGRYRAALHYYPEVNREGLTDSEVLEWGRRKAVTLARRQERVERAQGPAVGPRRRKAARPSATGRLEGGAGRVTPLRLITHFFPVANREGVGVS